MQVLGSLVRLPISNELPLPWWHRAPLGLQNSTRVYVALVQSAKRPLPDLIVSVLNPHKWSKMVCIECTHKEESGVVSKGVSIVKELNIALAESVTVEAGELHQLSLVCEPARRNDAKPDVAVLQKDLEEQGFQVTKLWGFDEGKLIWTNQMVVEGGWIKGLDWRSQIKEHCGSVPEFPDIDLDRVVISADTDRRLLRYVFPRQNARILELSHVDEPGVLRLLMELIRSRNLNVLSALLRRGGAKPGQAVLVAVCEPMLNINCDGLFEGVEEDVKHLPPDIMAKITISQGIYAGRTIAPAIMNTVVARIPDDLLEKVRRVRLSIPQNSLPVFLSRRFTGDEHAKRAAVAVRTALNSNGCFVLEAPEEGIVGEHLIYSEVTARMWAAQAAIVVVTSLRQEGDHVGKNIPHEFGFMVGQGKPVFLLTEEGIDRWSNVDGVFYRRFPNNDIAFTSDASGSIDDLVRKWVPSVKEYLRRRCLEP